MKEASTHSIRSLFLFALIAVLVAGLVIIWKRLPTRLAIPPSSPTSTGPVEGSNQNAKIACDAAGGKWVDCGNPCHGKGKDTVCIQVCEPQCLCGGIAGWQCPKNLTCTDYEPNAQTPDALGVCRSEASPTPPPQATNHPALPPVPAGMICDDESHSICVSTSYQNTLLASPFSVTGTAVAFESTFAWRLEDAQGVKLESGSVMAKAPDAGIPGPFEISSFILRVPTSATGTLVLFEPSAKDGTPIHTLRIPVKLPQTPMTVKLVVPADVEQWKQAFNGGEDLRSTVPLKTLSVQVVKTQRPLEATLRKLIEWMKEQELCPDFFELESIRLQNGVAYITLNIDHDAYAGISITLGRIDPLIEKTAKLFPGVQSVVR